MHSANASTAQAVPTRPGAFAASVSPSHMFLGVSRGARASQSSTESGITSTALERRRCASAWDEPVNIARNGEVVPCRNTHFFAFRSCSRSEAASQIFMLCPTCCAALARMILVSLFC